MAKRREIKHDGHVTITGSGGAAAGRIRVPVDLADKLRNNAPFPPDYYGKTHKRFPIHVQFVKNDNGRFLWCTFDKDGKHELSEKGGRDFVINGLTSIFKAHGFENKHKTHVAAKIGHYSPTKGARSKFFLAICLDYEIGEPQKQIETMLASDWLFT